jgi:radical SAM superfamily enzyme YgiQ (UPF0313 family)
MKKPIFLLDLTHESALGYGSDTMPLQLGLIGSACIQELGSSITVDSFKFIDDLSDAFKNTKPFIVAASNYVWNLELTYKVLEIIKRKYPSTVVVMGGPNYPDNKDEQIAWLSDHPIVDFYIYKDGELPFVNLVAALLKTTEIEEVKSQKVRSCHALIDGNAFFGELEPRLKDLTKIPSPYTTGLMDKYFNKRLIPSLITNRGCPFTCTFCVEGLEYYNKVSKASVERSIGEVNYIVKRLDDTKTLRIADSNFGMYKNDVLFCEHLGKLQKETGYPEYIHCSAGKNKKDRITKCNDLVNGAMRFTASVQSLDQRVLTNIQRNNISLETLMDISNHVSDTDTYSYSEVILALPDSTLESEFQTMGQLVNSTIGNITQHQLSLIPATELASQSSRDKYGMKSMYRPMQRSLGQYTFDANQFVAIDIEEICVSTNVLSFQDYIEARILYLTVGMFYNDGIFSEINALLKIKNIPIWNWILLIHNNRMKLSPKIQRLYEEFREETENELWSSREQLIKDVSKNLASYTSSENGGNLIYKYRSKAIMNCFEDLHYEAVKYLKIYIKERKEEVPNQLIRDLSQLILGKKNNVLDTTAKTKIDCDYDIEAIVQDSRSNLSLARLDKYRYPIQIEIDHNEIQKSVVARQLEFYDVKNDDLTFFMSRYPIRRLFRKVERIYS